MQREHQESRFILVDAVGRIRPTRHLVHPSLSVCQLSRDVAQNFFTTKLEVFLDEDFEFSSIDPIDFSHPVDKGTVYFRIDKHLEVYVDRYFDWFWSEQERGPWNLPIQHHTESLSSSLRSKFRHIREVDTSGKIFIPGASLLDYQLRDRPHPDQEAEFHPYLRDFVSRVMFSNIQFSGCWTRHLIFLPSNREKKEFIMDLSCMDAEDIIHEPEGKRFTFVQIQSEPKRQTLSWDSPNLAVVRKNQGGILLLSPWP